MNDSPRLIGRKEAAEYCGISPTCFSMWVASHKMPPAIPGTRKWDKRAIDAKLDEISGLTTTEPDDAYVKWVREHGGEQETGLQGWRRQRDSTRPEAPPSNYEDWKAKKLKRREKYRPQLGLDAKLERILRFMADHPDCDTIDTIPGAGQVLMERLIANGAIRLIGKDGGLFTYALTEQGHAELHRLKKWKSLTP
ncbi:helix-turn-helix transcriptional regulator [Sinorhizobium meliloti]|uniref:helix-turn-helix transcriptional regulator n=1 Tax=Rhizobium meliloti TaxID=382 RepID=UPI0037041DE9